MFKLHFRLGLALALLAGAAALSASLLYPRKMVRGELQAEALPYVISGWSGQKVEIEDYVKRILETEDVIQRNYVNPLYKNIPVQMAVVYSPDNRRVAHPPEICYRGGGYEINSNEEVRLQGIPPMIRLQISRGQGFRDLVLYTFKTGNLLTANYYQQQLNIVKSQFAARSSSSGLIRFSSRIMPDESDAEAQARMVAFIREIMPEIQKTLK